MAGPKGKRSEWAGDGGIYDNRANFFLESQMNKVKWPVYIGIDLAESMDETRFAELYMGKFTPAQCENHTSAHRCESPASKEFSSPSGKTWFVCDKCHSALKRNRHKPAARKQIREGSL